MTRFVRNPDGAVHSVPDDFQFPSGEGGTPVQGWSDVKSKDASPQLLGEPDPQVVASQLHNGAEAAVPISASSVEVGSIAEVTE
jgi:hypothetical protein